MSLGDELTFRRTYSGLLAVEAGVPVDIMKEALAVEGRDEAAKPRVITAAQRIWSSRGPSVLSMPLAEPTTLPPLITGCLVLHCVPSCVRSCLRIHCVARLPSVGCIDDRLLMRLGVCSQKLL